LESTSPLDEPAGAGGLRGKRIAVSRGNDETAPLAALLAPFAVEVMAVPLIAIEPPSDPEPLRRAAAAIEQYAWVVVASAHAAAALARARGPAPWPPAVRVAAVGAGTAEALAAHAIPVAFVPAQAEGAALAAGLATEHSLAGARILFPRSDRARRAVPDGLRAAGARVDEVEAYRTRLDVTAATALATALARGEVDALVLTSPSNADSLAQVAGARFAAAIGDVRLIAIGPTTAARLSELGRPADAEARSPDPAGILAALTRAFGRAAPQAATTPQAAISREQVKR
jgi:uroporphyrinogen-III synthase